MRSHPGLLVLLASVLPACLLYTDPLNSAPQVTIVSPETIFPGGEVTFAAHASDPDGDVPTLFWSTLPKACDPKDSAWKDATRVQSDSFDVKVSGHDPFCVRVIAQDKHFAETDNFYPATPKNRDPKVTLATDPAATAVPLFSTVRVMAGPDKDEDGDTVAFTWKGTDGSGVDLPLMACDAAHPNVRCFVAGAPGAYGVSVVGSDGIAGSTPGMKSVTVMVLADAPPCIEASDPSSDTDLIVLAATDPPRHFEVRQVRDDGNPFPPSAHGGASFQWSTARDLGPGTAPVWRREPGYDRATFDVGASLFDDVRPGSDYMVRVEVMDPAHQSAAELRDLDIACGVRPICTLADTTCPRWLLWKVHFR